MMLRKFFLKRLKKYTLILFLPLFAVMLATLFFFSRNQINYIKVESKSSADRLETNIDQLFSDVIYQQSIITGNPSIILSLRKMLTDMTMDYSNYSMFNTMTGLIRSVNMANPYIISIYYYQDGCSRIYSSEDGIKEISTFPDSTFTNYLGRANSGKNYVTTRKYLTDSFSKEKEILTFYMSMPTMKGTAVINISMDNLISRMNSLRANPYESLFALNDNGEILFYSSDNVRLSEDDLSVITNKAANNKNLSKEWIKLGSKNYWISTYYGPTTDILYVSLISSDVILASMRTTLLGFLIIFVAAFVAVFIISYRVTNDSFSHIQKIIDTFSDAEKGIYPGEIDQKINDEYDIILMNILKLFLNSTLLKSNLERQQFEKQVVELAALQLQINPHFLSNTLQTLDFESRKLSGGKPTQLNRIITDLSDILRYSLRPSNTLVPLKEELDALKKYIDIQQYRFGDALVFYTEIDDTALNFYVPRLILQPIVENSISHGILPSNRTGFIKLKALSNGERLTISVTDTGVGMNRNELLKLRKQINSSNNNNIGLSNVNRRLILTYGPESALHIISKEKYGCSISFSAFQSLSSNAFNKVFLSTEEENNKRDI